MTQPLIIGLGHAKRVGKDTLAQMVSTNIRAARPDWKVRIVGFADKLKDICEQLYGWDGLRDKDFYNTEEGAALREVKLPEIGLTPREIWIRMGTPAVREQVYQQTWIECALRPVDPPDVLIVPDVRFPNEAYRIKALEGLLLKVERPGYEPANDVADRALAAYLGWHAIVHNDGDLDLLDHKAATIAAHVCGGYPISTLPIMLGGQ